MSSQDCTFQGDSDIYGLGIRIGLYLQWLSFIIANFFYLESIGAAFVAYVAFQIAIIAAAFALTFTGGPSAYSSEIAILLYLYWGGNLIVDFASQESTSGRANAAIYDLGSSVMSAYSVWFWTTIGRTTYFEDLENCSTVVFFFDGITGNILRNVGIFYAILSGIYGIGTMISSAQSLIWLIALIQETFRPLSLEYRLEMINFLNEECPGWVYRQGALVNGLPKALWCTLRVEDISHTHIMFRNDYRTVRHTCAVSIPLYGKLEADRKRLVASLRQKEKLKLPTKAADEVWHNNSTEVNNFWNTYYGQWSSPKGEECETLFEFIQEICNLRWNIDVKDEASLVAWSRSYRQLFHLLGTILRLLVLIWTVVAIELMIVWNGITGVYVAQSVGQLIPLVIGIMGILGTLNDVRTKFQDVRLEAERPFEVDDARFEKLFSPQARYHMQSEDSKWH